jgi:hypothetical protein
MRSLLLIALLLLVFELNAQEEEETILEERIEWISQELEGEDLDLTTLTELYRKRIRNPLDLNSFRLDDMAQLYLLNPDEIRAIIWYRETYGGFETIFELKAVQGLSLQKAKLIAPFVGLNLPQASGYRKKSLKYARHQLIARTTRVLEEKLGYSNGVYAGDPNRMYLRYRLRKSDFLSIGFTAEKDPGEAFGSKGFDFNSAHLMIENIGPVKRFIVGDYQAQFGQALNLWSGFGFRKSPMQVLQTQRFARGLLPYTSTDENNFLRGAAVEFEWKSVQLHAFYSRKKIDGNISSADNLSENVLGFSSIQSSGLHRTEGEIEDKDAIGEEIAGAVVEFNAANFQIGVVNYMSRYDAEFDRDLSLYNQFDFDSSFNFVSGLYYRAALGKVQIYGEGSRSINGGLAMVQGILLPLHERFRLNYYFRHFETDYQNLLSNALSEKSRISNESGHYFGIEILPVSGVRIQAFADLYEFPWLLYRIDAPSDGAEFSLMTEWQVSRKLKAIALYRYEEKSENSSVADENIRPVVDESLHQLRLQVHLEINENWSLRNRLSFRGYGKDVGNSEGTSFYQDIYYQSSNAKWGAKFRYALFNTDGYDSRIYTYEHDLLYQFSVPAYDGVGYKSYLLLRWLPSKNIRWEVKLSRLGRRDVRELGSGNETIALPRRTEIKTQLILSL